MTAKDPQGWLTEFQVEVAQIFFSLPASGGFLLAGGAALLAHGLTARPTQDVDFSSDLTPVMSGSLVISSSRPQCR